MNKFNLTPQRALPLTYHNAAELVEGRQGVTPQRVPQAWRARFPEHTASRAQHAAGVELRFRAATRYIALDLQAASDFGAIMPLALYHGYRNVGLVTLPAPSYEGRVVLLNQPDAIGDALLAPWRILCPYNAVTTLKTLYLFDEAALLPADGRRVRWLAHGDSITQGAYALHPGLTYVNLVADALGWDAFNLGFAGAAWGDAAVAEYIAARDDWDVLSIAIGTNTYGGQTESAADYATRYERFLAIIRATHPRQPILCLTPIWRGQDGPPGVPNRFGDPPAAYREAITRVVLARQPQDAALTLLDGLSLIGSARGLTADQVHPDLHGMLAMAQSIAAALQRICGERSAPVI